MDIEAVARILPFKTNNYVVNELIDWDNFENDPLFILNFPQKNMLQDKHYHRISNLIHAGESKRTIIDEANNIRMELNPHPAGQLEHNIPRLHDERLPGLQHKYRETLLFFPSQGQTCHAYCTFCFRWPQFTGLSELKFAMKQADLLVAYLKDHPEISDILFTGGDPMVMKTSTFKRYIDAILEADLPHLTTIRIGTKALSFWPYRFVSDEDADEMLWLFEKIVSSGKHLTIMAHFNHYRELETNIAQFAIKRIRTTGAQIRTQSPLLNHINANPEIWAEMWRRQVNLGIVPYYMFLARQTGAQHYFSVSLANAYHIFKKAYSNISGIGRTVRGPSMSANPGKIKVLGISEIFGEKVFVLSFIQGRNPSWVKRPFYARFDPLANWITDLQPAFGKEKFFYEEELHQMLMG